MIKVFQKKTDENKLAITEKLKLLSENSIIENDILDKYQNLIKNNDITLTLRDLLISGLNQAQSIYKNGFANEDFLNSFYDAYQALMSVPAEARNNIIQQFINNGFTKGGLLKTLNYINDNEIEVSDKGIDALDTLIHNSLVNIKLDIDTATSTLMEDLKSIESFISSLSGFKGSDLTELQQDAQSLGLEKFDLSEFNTDGNNLVLAYSDTEDLLLTLKNKYLEQFNDTIDSLDNAKEALNENLDDLDAARILFGGDFEQFYTKIATVGENGEITYNWQLNDDFDPQVIEDYYDESITSLNNYFDLVNLMFSQLLKSTQWDYGNYESLLNANIYKDIYETTDELNEHLLELASGEELSTEELNNPDILAARDKIRSAYDDLITDLLNKGIDEIDLSNYKGLIGVDEISGSYSDLIQDYAKRAGYSTQEVNDVLLQAIEKDNEAISNDIIKDLQFINKTQFRATFDKLLELAKRFNLDLTKATLNYDSQLGEFIVNYSDIDGLEDKLQNVEGFQEIVADSINEFFDSLIDLIGEGLSGSLSAVNASKLKADVKQYLGIDNLDFTETAEGLKLSEKSAIKLYSVMKKVNSLKAGAWIEDLNKSLQETNQHYKSIGSIQARIVELEKVAPNARSEEYQEELELAKEIYAIRSITDEDSSFNFMSADIPAMQKNPLNYAKNWTEAFKRIREAYKVKKKGKTGFIDYEDYYNIIT